MRRIFVLLTVIWLFPHTVRAYEYVPIADAFGFPVAYPIQRCSDNRNADSYYRVDWDLRDKDYTILCTDGVKGHTGEDWNGGGAGDDDGQPVYAIAAGEIMNVTSGEGKGTVVLLKHRTWSGITLDSVFTSYCHLSSREVGTSGYVTRGQLIGRIGHTGGADGAHLHLEVLPGNFRVAYAEEYGIPDPSNVTYFQMVKSWRCDEVWIDNNYINPVGWGANTTANYENGHNKRQLDYDNHGIRVLIPDFWDENDQHHLEYGHDADVIVDDEDLDPAFHKEGVWTDSFDSDGKYRYRKAPNPAPSGLSARWQFQVSEDGTYEIYAQYWTGASSAASVIYLINDGLGSEDTETNVDQRGPAPFNFGPMRKLLRRCQLSASHLASVRIENAPSGCVIDELLILKSELSYPLGEGSTNAVAFQTCFDNLGPEEQGFAMTPVVASSNGIGEFQLIREFDGEEGAIMRRYVDNIAYYVHGGIYMKYRYDMGGPTGVLGFPLSNEGEAPASPPYGGVRTRGRYTTFELGHIDYIREPANHPQVGQSFAVFGPIYEEYRHHGFSGWHGYPTSDVSEVLCQQMSVEEGGFYEACGSLPVEFHSMRSPRSLNATPAPNYIRIEFEDNSDFETAFIVVRSTPDRSMRSTDTLAILPENTVAYDDYNVSSGFVYQYHVVAAFDTVFSNPTNDAFARLGQGDWDIYVNSAEYFFDTDPGQGRGRLISIQPTNEPLLTKTIDLRQIALLQGFHRLFLRYRDSRGIWSAAEGRSFYVTQPAPAGNLTINAAETYYDSDPGVGHGSTMSVTPGDEVTITAAPSMTGIVPGFHRLYLRYRTNSNLWSSAEGRSFYVTPPITEGGQLLASAEYFLDSDPGIGQAHAVDFPDSTDVTLTEAVSPFITTIGFHRLFLRYSTAGGIWSAVEGRSLYVTPPVPEGGEKLASAEYFLDADPGTGQGNAIDFLDSTEVTLTEVVSPLTTSTGFHRLYLRYLTLNGVWSAAEGRSLYVTPSVAGDSLFIAGGEIFIDSLGSYGAGTAMEADDGGFDENEEDMHKYQQASTLTLGQHFVYARVRDNLGLWSNVVRDSFTVGVPNDIRLVALPEDSAGEHVRLAWTSFPSATEYHVHYDSIATGAFTEFITVLAPDTTAVLETPPGSGGRFFQVIAILPSRSAIAKSPETVPSTRESGSIGDARKER